MAAAGAAPAPRRYRSRAFRQSFLVAFATRIGQRLREAAGASVAEAEGQHGVALLPVLASRAEAVDDAVDGAFPGLRGRKLSAIDAAGWAAGAVAADLATLAVGADLDELTGS